MVPLRLSPLCGQGVALGGLNIDVLTWPWELLWPDQPLHVMEAR